MWTRDNVTLHIGDVMAVLPTLPERSVHTVVTSPPYFALRSYLPKGHADKDKEIGSEPTPEAFIATMVAVFREVRRVLRDDGALWLNLGDGYSAGGRVGHGTRQGYKQQTNVGTIVATDIDRPQGGESGQLLNIPHRVAEALRADGWIWRQTIVWAKRCLSGGTWLYARTAKGDAPAMLKDLVRLDPKTVQLWDGKKWTQVLGWTRTPTERGSRRKNGNRHYLELVLRSGERVGCTAEHRWPTERGVVFASDLRVGDVIQTCRLPEPSPVPGLYISECDFGWLCGFYLAEGCKTDKGVNFSVHVKETAAYERIRNMAESLGGTATWQKHEGKSAAIVVYCKAMRELIADFIVGSSCYNKRLGRKAWARGDGFLEALLNGYLEGDGHWREDAGQWVLGFCNNDGLAVDLRCLSARLGKVCVLRRVMHKCGDKKHPGWRGRIRESSLHHNAEPIGKIVAIENSRAREFWDIAVADEPNLFSLASGVLSHNSPMPESVGGWRWQRCRVKVGDSAKAKKQCTNMASVESIAATRGGSDLSAGSGAVNSPMTPEWQNCPGCPKCEPNGGYVLRRGSGRCTTAHEYIFLFAKTNRYFWDGEASKEAAQCGRCGWDKMQFKGGDITRHHGTDGSHNRGCDPSSGRNPRSVWTLSSEPSSIRHFATFPSELVRRCLASSPATGGVCAECGTPFAPVVESERVATRPGTDSKIDGSSTDDEHGNRDPERHCTQTKVNGYRPTCACGAGKTGPTIMDPFSGTGTTGQTARHLGCKYIGIDLNPEYQEYAKVRIFEPPRWWLRQQDNPSKPIMKPKQKGFF